MFSAKNFFLFSCCLLIPFCSFAGTIRGKVSDTKTGEPLSGALIEASSGDKKYTTYVNLDGSYAFHNLPVGEYTVSIKASGYKGEDEYTVTLKDDADSKEQDFNMQGKAQMLTEVSVTSSGN